MSCCGGFVTCPLHDGYHTSRVFTRWIAEIENRVAEVLLQVQLAAVNLIPEASRSEATQVDMVSGMRGVSKVLNTHDCKTLNINDLTSF